MDSKEYIENVLKTESCDMDKVRNRLLDGDIVRLLHAGIGMSTESGEFIDQLKKHVFYGKELDLVNLSEELGDVCWYIAVALHVLDKTWEDIWDQNIAKLKDRYKGKFTENLAINRNLESERKILEDNESSTNK